MSQHEAKLQLDNTNQVEPIATHVRVELRQGKDKSSFSIAIRVSVCEWCGSNDINPLVGLAFVPYSETNINL